MVKAWFEHGLSKFAKKFNGNPWEGIENQTTQVGVDKILNAFKIPSDL